MIRTTAEGYLYSSLDDTEPTEFVLPMGRGESMTYSTKPSVVYLGREGLDSPVYGMSTGVSDDGTMAIMPPTAPAPAPAPVLDVELARASGAPTTQRLCSPPSTGPPPSASVELAPDTTYRLESQLLLPSVSYVHGSGSSSLLAFSWTDNDNTGRFRQGGHHVLAPMLFDRCTCTST